MAKHGPKLVARHGEDVDGAAGTLTLNQLPLLMAGPIVRRTTPDSVLIWFAFSREVTAIAPKLTIFGYEGQVIDHLVGADGLVPLKPSYEHIWRFGARLWIGLVEVRPKDDLPRGSFVGYTLDITFSDPDAGVSDVYKLADELANLTWPITYDPFPWPTFYLPATASAGPIAHGSCRRPGSNGNDSFLALDDWMMDKAADYQGRPQALLLTGDQIYADDVAMPLMGGVAQLSWLLFDKQEEHIPDGSGHLILLGKTDDDGTRQDGRKVFLEEDVGFTTEDGERHLLGFGEFAAMYLLTWGPELCAQFNVDQQPLPDTFKAGGGDNLKEFSKAVAAARRVMANTTTYMLFDDHEITDDWNMDAEWQKSTDNPAGRRVIANGLAAYWAFQHCGNVPLGGYEHLPIAIANYAADLTVDGKPSAKSGKDLEKQFLRAHVWSFRAPTIPHCLFVDTRTKRDLSTHPAILVSADVIDDVRALAKGIDAGDPIVLVLPAPLAPWGGLVAGQDQASNYPSKKYEYDFEQFINNPGSVYAVAKLMRDLGDRTWAVFSGDVHYSHVAIADYTFYQDAKKRDFNPDGSVRLADWHEDYRALATETWSVRAYQITSSGIKNQNDNAQGLGKAVTTWPGADYDALDAVDGGMFRQHSVSQKLEDSWWEMIFPLANICLCDVNNVAINVSFISWVDGKRQEVKTTLIP